MEPQIPVKLRRFSPDKIIPSLALHVRGAAEDSAKALLTLQQWRFWSVKVDVCSFLESRGTHFPVLIFIAWAVIRGTPPKSWNTFRVNPNEKEH